MRDAVGFGALNTDLIYEGVKPHYLSRYQLKPGEEIFLPPEKIQELEELARKKGKLIIKSGGGSAANTVVALARFGFQTGFIGITGDDEDGLSLRNDLKENGVDTSHILQRRNIRSGRCFSFLHQGERTLMVFSGANDSLSGEEIDISYSINTRFFHLSSFVGEKPFAAQRKLVELICQHYPPVKISFSPGEIYVRRGMASLLPIINKSYLLFINQQEMENLTGENFLKAGETLLKTGPRIVVGTRGGKGSLIFSETGIQEIPAEKTEKVTDPTGAGDVYAAGFLAGLLLNLPLLTCGQIASRMASQSIKGYGRVSYPDRKNFETNWQELK